jgi:hypothetical protein
MSSARLTPTLLGGRVHDATHPGRRLDVAMLLAVVGIRLEEGHVEAVGVELAHDAAVIRRRAIPVRGQDAGTEKGHVRSCGHDTS